MYMSEGRVMDPIDRPGACPGVMTPAPSVSKSRRPVGAYLHSCNRPATMSSSCDDFAALAERRTVGRRGLARLRTVVFLSGELLAAQLPGPPAGRSRVFGGTVTSKVSRRQGRPKASGRGQNHDCCPAGVGLRTVIYQQLIEANLS
jgi:hypothetical protein